MDEQLAAEIQTALSYYHDEVIPALAAAITIDDAFPEEVLNEIRNAMTHVSRAYCMTDATSDARLGEARAAKRHLKRVVLDCMKVCILALATRSEAAIKALTDDIALPQGVYTSMSNLRRRRRELASHEGQNTPDQVIEDLKVLFNDFDLFYQGLDSQFAGDTAALRSTARRKSRWMGWFRDVVLTGLFIAIIGGVVSIVAWEMGLKSVFMHSEASEPRPTPESASETK